MPRCPINFAGVFRHTQLPLEYVISSGEPHLDRYLESHLTLVRPTTADEDS